MALFKRKPRVDLGRFTAPEPTEPAPVERVVEEGLMIATRAVSMAVKNRIIVDTIRDGGDFDAGALALVTREQLERLADQNQELARSRFTLRDIGIYRALADELRARSADDAALAAIVEQSREEAWREVSGAVATTLAARATGAADDPDYEVERESRLRALISVDLAQLELESIPEY